MTTKELEARIDLVIDRAPKLREAGVLELDDGELRVKLAPAAGEAPTAKVEEVEPTDQWEDEHLFPKPSAPAGQRKKGG